LQTHIINQPLSISMTDASLIGAPPLHDSWLCARYKYSSSSSFSYMERHGNWIEIISLCGLMWKT